jgi:hypothetical protein
VAHLGCPTDGVRTTVTYLFPERMLGAGVIVGTDPASWAPAQVTVGRGLPTPPARASQRVSDAEPTAPTRDGWGGFAL